MEADTHLVSVVGNLSAPALIHIWACSCWQSFNVRLAVGHPPSKNFHSLANPGSSRVVVLSPQSSIVGPTYCVL